MFAFGIAGYGAVAYALFFATFLHAIGFVGDLPLSKTIDSGEPGPVAWAIAVHRVARLRRRVRSSSRKGPVRRLLSCIASAARAADEASAYDENSKIGLIDVIWLLAALIAITVLCSLINLIANRMWEAVL